MLERREGPEVDHLLPGNIATAFSGLSVLKYPQDRGEKFKNKLLRGR
jgi:hypothetical protein